MMSVNTRVTYCTSIIVDNNIFFFTNSSQNNMIKNNINKTRCKTRQQNNIYILLINYMIILKLAGIRKSVVFNF